MNKSAFIKELFKETGYDESKCLLINNVIENHFIVGRKNKERIINNCITKIGLNEDEACNLYDIIIKIIITELKNKIKHPFKNKK